MNHVKTFFEKLTKKLKTLDRCCIFVYICRLKFKCMQTSEEVISGLRGTKIDPWFDFKPLIIKNDLGGFIELLNQVLSDITTEEHLSYWANELIWRCFFW